MTSNEFETVAKNAVIQVCREDFGRECVRKMLQTIWHGHKDEKRKAVLIDNGSCRCFYEVTYNGKELTVDVYGKLSRMKIQDVERLIHKPPDGEEEEWE